jgi:hypothetical protein
MARAADRLDRRGDPGARGLCHSGRAFEPGADLLRPIQGVKFLAADAIGFAGLGLAVPHRHPALKELEEWFDSQEEARAIAKLDPFFERTNKLASRRLKREIERRGTLGEFALEPDPPHLVREVPSRGKWL